MFGFSYGDLRSTEARAGLARLCSALNAPTAACEAKDDLRKRSAVEGMLWFGYKLTYLCNRTLNDVNL